MGQQQPIIQGSEEKVLALEPVKQAGFVTDRETVLASEAAKVEVADIAVQTVNNSETINQSAQPTEILGQTSAMDNTSSAAGLVADGLTNKDLLAQEFAPQAPVVAPNVPVATEVIPAPPAQFTSEAASVSSAPSQDNSALLETLSKAKAQIEQVESNAAALKTFLDESIAFVQNQGSLAVNNISYQTPASAAPEGFAPFAVPNAGETNMFDEPKVEPLVQNQTTELAAQPAPTVNIFDQQANSAPNPVTPQPNGLEMQASQNVNMFEQQASAVIPVSPNPQPAGLETQPVGINQQGNNVTQFPMGNQPIQSAPGVVNAGGGFGMAA